MCECKPCEPGYKGRTYHYVCSLCGSTEPHAVPSSALRGAGKPAASKFQFRGTTAWSTPLESIGAGCHPNQVESFNKMAKQHGMTGVHYRKDGVCEFSTRGQRREWNQIRGMHDKDGGYGD